MSKKLFKEEVRSYTVLIADKSLRKTRKSMGVSLRSVARESDLNPSFLSKVELGSRGVSTKIAARIERALSRLSLTA